MKLEDIPDNAELQTLGGWERFTLIPSQARKLYALGNFTRWQSFKLACWAAWLGLPYRVVIPAADSFNGRKPGSQPANTGSTPVSATN